MSALKRTHIIASHVAAASREAAGGAIQDDCGEATEQGERPHPHKRVDINFEFQDTVAVSSRRRVTVQWSDPIRRVLLVKKMGSREISAVALDVARWLTSRWIVIFVEADDLAEYTGLAGVFALETREEHSEAIDLVVSLGGDGTLLHASRLFRFLERCNNRFLPPCLVLGLGSLGFLATVAAVDWKPALHSVLHGNVDSVWGWLCPKVPCTLRTRLCCSLQSTGGSTPMVPWYGLNECVVLSRGNSLGKLMISVDGTVVTRAEGDGIIISSPTGSTGYSLSCGGPIVSPSVPCTLLTPIAPASLSFRPLLISELSVIEILLPPKARLGTAEVIVDGRPMGKLERGGKVIITVARPIPILNVAGLDSDWFDAINTKLKWNARDVEQADID